jgi:5-methylcytosine-specific restriction endonuclease McrA
MGRSKENLIGQRFGLLTVRRLSEFRRNLGRQWECLCDCGGIRLVTTSHLKDNSVRTCGCRQVNRQQLTPHYLLRTPEDAATSRVFSHYMAKCRAKSVSFQLTAQQFRDLTTSPCHYCGEVYTRAVVYKQKSGVKTSVSLPLNGVDRKDSSKGYELENAVSCCPRCNRAKNDTPYNQFLQMCRDVASRHSIEPHA